MILLALPKPFKYFTSSKTSRRKFSTFTGLFFCNLSPFVEFQLLESVNLRNEGPERFRMGLKHLEKSDGTDGLDIGLKHGPGVPKELLLGGSH